MLEGSDKAGDGNHPSASRLALFGPVSSFMRSLRPPAGTSIVYCDNPVTNLPEASTLPIYDVAAIDIDIGPAGTSNPIRVLCNRYPSRPVIGITERDEIKTICLAVDAGAAGILHVADVRSGKFDFRSVTVGDSLASLSPRIARLLLNELRDDHPLALQDSAIGFGKATAPRNALLSARECEILRLSAAGMVGREIAGHLSISPHTIATHFKNIYRKLEVNTRGEAVFKAHRAGLI